MKKDTEVNGSEENGRVKNSSEENGRVKNSSEKNGSEKNGSEKNGREKNGRVKNSSEKNGREKNGCEKKEQPDAQNRWEADLIDRIERIEETAGAVQTMTKRDYIVAGVITIVCLLFVVAGAFIS